MIVHKTKSKSASFPSPRLFDCSLLPFLYSYFSPYSSLPFLTLSSQPRAGCSFLAVFFFYLKEEGDHRPSFWSFCSFVCPSFVVVLRSLCKWSQTTPLEPNFDLAQMTFSDKFLILFFLFFFFLSFWRVF